MKRFIPKFLKYPLISIYIFARLVLRGSGSKEIRLNLAGVLPPVGSRKIIHGGKVKLLHLREKFGDTWQHFNIAYFVSSGLPSMPSIWIKLYKAFGVKVVWNQNGVAYPALYPTNVVENINSLMKNIHKADYVIYQTEFTKRCADKFLGVFNGLSEILINPVDTEKFQPKVLLDDPLVILMLGNHFESKERMDISIGALKILREKDINIKLIIIGQIQYDINEDWIEKHGAYLQKDAPAIFQSAHIFLHLKYLDPCPTTVLEALASGLPVVGQANGGMSELVDGAGILLPSPEDFEKLHYPSAEAVAEVIMRVRSDLPRYRTLARAKALQFDKTLWLKQHEEIFNKLCQPSP